MSKLAKLECYVPACLQRTMLEHARRKLHLPPRSLCRLTVSAGHSLGGALACLGAFEIKRAYPTANVRVYTFGEQWP